MEESSPRDWPCCWRISKKSSYPPSNEQPKEELYFHCGKTFFLTQSQQILLMCTSSFSKKAPGPFRRSCPASSFARHLRQLSYHQPEAYKLHLPSSSDQSLFQCRKAARVSVVKRCEVVGNRWWVSISWIDEATATEFEDSPRVRGSSTTTKTWKEDLFVDCPRGPRGIICWLPGFHLQALGPGWSWPRFRCRIETKTWSCLFWMLGIPEIEVKHFKMFKISRFSVLPHADLGENYD